MNILDCITAIPDVIWSGVIASILTLSGVLISNRSNTYRIKLQLKHDAEEREKERKSELRRDVYLTAAEEITKANSYISTLPQLDLTKPNPDHHLQGFFAAAAKLQLISEPKTALLVGELVGAYGELILRLLAKIQPIHSIRSEISILDDMYNRYHAEVLRVLASMTQFNESAQRDPVIFQALNKTFEYNQGQAVKFSEERTNQSKQQNALNISFSRELLNEMKNIYSLQIPVIVAIRSELELHSDTAELSEQMESQLKRMSSQLDVLLNQLESA